VARVYFRVKVRVTVSVRFRARVSTVFQFTLRDIFRLRTVLVGLGLMLWIDKVRFMVYI
jgi:hypothetical protein